MNMFKLKRGWILIAGLLLAMGIGPGLPERVYTSEPAKAENIEVVMTIPVETELGIEGIANAADTWVKMIDGASKSLDFAHFYLSNQPNERLEPVIKAIIKAADRGVRVRFLVGTPVNKEMGVKTAEVKERFVGHKNIAVITFNWKPLKLGILHAKYFIVDGRESFVGSQNFDWRSLKHIHETGFRMKSRVMAKSLTAIFEADWQFNGGDKDAYVKLKKQTPLIPGKESFIVSSPEIYNPPGVKDALKTLVKLIDGAKQKITVQLLNYHIDIYRSTETFTDIDDALRRAAKRGVSVKLLVSDWNKGKPGVNGLKALVKVPNIEVKFATIPAYSKGFIPYARVIHSKVMRIDERVSWVGTSNWGKRYFFGSRNIEVVSYLPGAAKILDGLFDKLWNSKYTYVVDPKKEYKAPKRS
ncbi:MAG: phospholipase [bacterium]|nr:phospholipase [bacterium]